MIRSLPLLLLLTAEPLAAASGPLDVTSSVMVEQRSRAPDGTTRVTLAPAARVVPGDRVVFVVAYRNTGTQPLSNLAIVNPLPAGIAYRAPAAGTAEPEVSVDGRSFAALAALRSGDRAATGDDVTHVRWRLARPLAPGAQGRLAFQAVLK
ncbi:hypothetical protein [Sphingomonas sp. RS2018]